MEIFWQCVEDLATIERLLELPHGREIAVQMFREVSPFLELLDAMKARDPSGGIKRVVEFASVLQRRLELETVRLTA
jgi:hypothetical protein